MFISEITATQDETNQYGWAGDIVFMQYMNLDTGEGPWQAELVLEKKDG